MPSRRPTFFIFLYELRDARKAHEDFHNDLIRKSIHIDQELFLKFSDVDALLRKLIQAAETTHLDRGDREAVMEAAKTYRESKYLLDRHIVLTKDAVFPADAEGKRLSLIRPSRPEVLTRLLWCSEADLE